MTRPRIPLRDLPPGARLYILTVVAAGLAMFAWRLAVLPFKPATEDLVLLGFALLLGPRTVNLGLRVEMSVALPFIFTALLSRGMGTALDVGIVGMLSTCLARRQPFEPHRTAFNVCSILLTTLAAGKVYLLLNPDPSNPVPSNFLVPLLAAVLVYYFMNTSMVAVAVGLSRRVSIVRLWHESFLWTIISYFAGGSLAVGMVFLLGQFGIYSIVLALPPVLLIQYSYSLYLERMEERRRRIEAVEQLNADLERKVEQRTRELQELNQRLLESNEALQRANRLKSEFLANMSHELRTPLNAIIGFLELMKEGIHGSLNEEQKDFVSDIHDAGRHLLSLINSILDLSKIEAGRMNLSREEFAFSLLIRDCITVVKPLAMKKSLEIVCRLDGAPAVAWADSGMLKQIMYNLLSNAVKFTPEGGRIEVRAWAEGRHIVTSVADTGIGIAPEDRDRIFSEFYQVDGSHSRRYQGTGLGLALARRFVEMHGGTITVESEPGLGSTFTFRIPDGALSVENEGPARGTPVPAVTRAEGPDEPARGVVLVVEDNPMNMKLTSRLLAGAGFQVIEARSSEEAMERLSENRPDLILMDIQLPGMDGLALTRLLKTSPRTAGIPTVALTAHAMKGDEQRALEAGCCGYIPKPIDPARFAGQVTGFLRVPAA